MTVKACSTPEIQCGFVEQTLGSLVGSLIVSSFSLKDNLLRMNIYWKFFFFVRDRHSISKMPPCVNIQNSQPIGPVASTFFRIHHSTVWLLMRD